MWKFGCVFDSQSPYAPWSLNMLYAKMEFGITLQRQIDLLSKPWVDMYHYHAYRHPLLDETSSIEWNAGFLKKELPTWRKTSSWHLCLRLKSLWKQNKSSFFSYLPPPPSSRGANAGYPQANQGNSLPQVVAARSLEQGFGRDNGGHGVAANGFAR